MNLLWFRVGKRPSSSVGWSVIFSVNATPAILKYLFLLMSLLWNFLIPLLLLFLVGSFFIKPKCSNRYYSLCNRLWLFTQCFFWKRLLLVVADRTFWTRGKYFFLFLIFFCNVQWKSFVNLSNSGLTVVKIISLWFHSSYKITCFTAKKF